MKISKIKTLALSALMFAGMVGTGNAATVFETVTDKSSKMFAATKTVVFVVGGFGLVGLAIGAIFGRVDWKKFAALAIGLAILAAAGAIVDYATDAGTPANFGDTLGK